MSVPTDDFVKADFVDGKITLPHAGAFWRYLGFKVRDLSVQTDIRTDDKIVKSKEGNEMKTILDKKKLFTFIYTVLSS